MSRSPSPSITFCFGVSQFSFGSVTNFRSFFDFFFLRDFADDVSGDDASDAVLDEDESDGDSDLVWDVSDAAGMARIEPIQGSKRRIV